VDEKLYCGIPRNRFEPVCAVDKFTSMSTGKFIDPIVRTLVEREFGNLPYALVQPTFSSLLLDISKYSNRWHFRQSPSHKEVIEIMRNEIAHLFETPLAVYGCMEACEYLNGTSSCGWPYNQMWKNKREAIRGGDGVPRLDIEVATRNFLSRRMCFWACNGKVEVRPIEKLENSNIRSFLSGSIDENVAALMYYGPACFKIATGWKTIPYTYGINNFQGGWHYLTSRWPEFMNNCYSTDQPKYDGGFSPFGHFVLPEVIFPFYSVSVPPRFPDVWDGMLSVAHAHAAGPVVMPNGLLLWRDVGNPSGSGLTIQANSFGYRYDFLDFCLSPVRDGGLGLLPSEVSRETHQDVHGDDSIIGSSSRLAESIHPERLSEFLQEQRGREIQITAYNEEPLPRSKCKYLSRVSILHRGCYVPSFEKPLKLVASLALNADKEIPDGFTAQGYQLTRMMAIRNELCFNENEWHQVSNVIDEYMKIHDKEHEFDVSWQNAKRVAKPLRFQQDRYLK
jgi:hypothetical protein